jgi:hypothetical protein
MKNVEVTIQVRFDLIWKINKRGLKFEFQAHPRFILHKQCRYMVRVL